MLESLRLWLREDTWVREGLRISLFKLREARWKLRYGLHSRGKLEAYLASTDVHKLNLGAGALVLEGFLNTDVFGDFPVNIAKRLPFDNNQFDLIYSSHVIEHIHLEEFKHFLHESLRILKPNGKNIIATPSLEKVARVLYGENDQLRSVLRKKHENSNKEPGFFASRHINNLTHLRWGHKFLYDFAFMDYLGREAGFTNVECVDNFAVPDKTMLKHLRKRKPEVWDIETETYVLTK